MMKQLLIIAIVACAVMADNYWCGQPGEVFECFESAPHERFCITNGKEHKVVCSKCRKKIEFCHNQMKKSKRPEHDCGSGWENTPCTPENSETPHTF